MKTRPVLFKFDAVTTIRRLPGSWQPADYSQVLKVLDMDDIASCADGDLDDMVLMALQDLEPEEAMRSILANFTGGPF